ncbi:helix-turn-helix domain-containing protein [Phycicoccus sp. 3266]|jgi:AcrR family transcriptional regulator|uniref:TetR/AcrR family transcriptional regulator n=1 Tax=Phycicoccus sp. 3266 TaxID=2817751 RepID=UPI002856CCFE|nr:helix-turn-helix domain-containing protein [Phycicoccus sp. 3266]MDR6862453.1 AcrR family transcriptional regulator [Phycicoccus sp. 3266]
MADEVKRSLSLREEQAAATRRRIADAARRLFAEQGYSTTSLAEVAREAGVAARTVYTVFGTKREILSAICEAWLEDARARERAQEVLALEDAAERLHGAGAWLAALYAAGFDVVQVLDSAVDEDGETRRLLRAKLAGRNRVMDAMVASAQDRLAAPLPEAQALFRAMAAPGVYQSLVVEAGWAPERFGSWLGDLLVRELLGG